MHLSIDVRRFAADAAQCSGSADCVCRAARALQHAILYRLTRVNRTAPCSLHTTKAALASVLQAASTGERLQPQRNIPSAPLEACTRSVTQRAPQRQSRDFDAPGQPKKAAPGLIIATGSARQRHSTPFLSAAAARSCKRYRPARAAHSPGIRSAARRNHGRVERRAHDEKVLGGALPKTRRI